MAEEKAKKSGRSSGNAGRRRNRPSPRQRLLDSATTLFTTEGIRVVGIDRILREADVAKASLYSLFGSKDALVIAYLQQLDEQWRARYAKRIEDMENPSDKILAFFDQCIEEEPQKDFRGSLFRSAVNEYPCPEADSEKAIVATATAHRQWCLDTIAQLLEEKNGYPGTSQAQQILIFLDGGLAGAQLAHSIEPLNIARDLALMSLSAPPVDYSI
ncbi:TetR/AcrR family transcriptional regulator [Corynebacterium sp. sy017]|uniref:TetR/AcrR family transcriptional regulator n=1 Tax=unclassified Corynebacterium TaxID=2624378 RepID=UPI0011865645|nr:MULTISPECIES: TetR/AcrR family transcriptional regulator [unclassified Corynebacterium]MBP3089471.1 TetR/AcrR family transcriptional regulator [Corynebacterium sp. sy017]QDZ43392.1 TetR/AcrR family transcriptional regulator [Corynebacterium sp. sy039]TSD90848.1 TetR/AcrR family transcriptional regulator [Corynebacterium sp. SY003]